MSAERQRVLTALRPPTWMMRRTEVTREKRTVPLQLTAPAPTASCPPCAGPASSLHRRDQRHLTDLPWGPRAVPLQLLVRKFGCRQPTGARRLCTARRPDVVAPAARQTTRLSAVLQPIGPALGGQAGVRLAARLGRSTSAATLVRLGRAACGPPTPALQAMGVDAWAWPRGRRVGPSLVDRLRHRVLDLLPARSAAAVAAWLAPHPPLTVVCRERRPLDADGMRQGAPDAVPVVARVQLVDHRRDARAAFLRNQRGALQAAAARTAPARTPPEHAGPVTPMSQGRRRSPQPQRHRADAERQPRHAPWVAIDEARHTLQAQGIPRATSARQLGISRPTVSASRRRTTPPGPKRPPCQWTARGLTPVVLYRIRRWRER
jgi:transposase